LAALAGAVLEVQRPHAVRVAIDGCSAAGKTTLSDELAQTLRGLTPREVIRASIDHFKRALALRTRFPHNSPESYYLDSWDNDAIRDELLLPLGPDGSRRYRSELMDFAAVTVLDGPIHNAPDDAILIADGCFLSDPSLTIIGTSGSSSTCPSTTCCAAVSPATRCGCRPWKRRSGGIAPNTFPARAAISPTCARATERSWLSTTATSRHRGWPTSGTRRHKASSARILSYTRSIHMLWINLWITTTLCRGEVT
jgi:hypothetical protein